MAASIVLMANGLPLAAGAGEILFDLAQRRAELAAAPPDERPRLCGELRGKWPRHGVTRNVTGREQPGMTLAETLMYAGGVYLGYGDEGARKAILRNLNRWATRDGLASVGDPEDVNAWYNLDRTLLPMIVAFWLVHDDPDLAGDMRLAAIRDWLDELVRRRGPERPLDPEKVSSRNNHRYLRDSVTMAWGAFIGDPVLFAAGVEGFGQALDQMRPDGSLPLETDRGARALFYQRHAVGSLVTIAEIAAANGTDLWSYETSGGRTLHDAVAFLVEALEDPAVMARYTPKPQDLRFLVWRGHGRHYMAWAEAYMRRFRGTDLADRLEAILFASGRASRPLADDYAGGMTTCFYTDPGALDPLRP